MNKKVMGLLCVLTMVALLAVGLFGCSDGTQKDDTYNENGNMQQVDLSQNVQKLVSGVRSSSTIFKDVTIEGKLQTDTGKLLPASSTTASATLAEQALLLASGNGEEKTEEYFVKAGFDKDSVKHFNYEYNLLSDVRHTAAYSTATQTVTYNGETCTLEVVAIRGTNGNEWYSNFDFAPSRDVETNFAENFLFAATDIYLQLVEEASVASQKTLFLVCGHSRGGAVANLLTWLLNEKYGSANVFGYTFATPNTVKGTLDGVSCDNVFNYVYGCDIVGRMPLADWGYKRLGTDIMLSGNNDKQNATETESLVAVLGKCVPSIDEYYNARWSLTEEGKSINGVTPFELSTAFVAAAKSASGDRSELTNINKSALGTATANSHYAPLFDKLIALANNPLKAIAIVNNHLPSTYQQLIEALQNA